MGQVGPLGRQHETGDSTPAAQVEGQSPDGAERGHDLGEAPGVGTVDLQRSGAQEPPVAGHPEHLDEALSPRPAAAARGHRGVAVSCRGTGR